MPRAYPARAAKKRGAVARGEAAFHMPFTDLTGCVRSATPAGAEHNDISRETTTAPPQRQAKAAGGGANAFSSMPNRKTHTPAKTMPASCPPGKCPANNTRRVRLSVISFNIGCSFPAASLGTPCDAPSESLKKTGVSPKRPFFPSNLAIQNRAAPGFPRPQKGGPWESPLPTRPEGS